MYAVIETHSTGKIKVKKYTNYPKWHGCNTIDWGFTTRSQAEDAAEMYKDINATVGMEFIKTR